MGRKEDRMLKRAKGESFRRQMNGAPTLSPFMVGDTRMIPVRADNVKAPVMQTDDEPEAMTAKEFMKISHELSDKELNRIIYQNAKMAIEDGVMPPWPEDDFGIVKWFARSFITPEMRECFPAIAREYLAHYRSADGSSAESRESEGVWEFMDIPYPRIEETTWDDAYYYRILLMMLYSARQGSDYSKNFLLSLYKVYYKTEYNKLKKLQVLTILDVMEFHDADCLRKGYPSGHTTNGSSSFKEMIIEKRRHEPGWTNVFGNRMLSPVPGNRRADAPHAEELNRAAQILRDDGDAPDEPPTQPTASRVFVMSSLMGIRIDETCNNHAVIMNDVAGSIDKVAYLSSPEYRKIHDELVERCKEFLHAKYPEMSDPYRYQGDERYLCLQVAEMVMADVFKKYDANVRLPYDSHRFDLISQMADMTVTLQMDFPEVKFSFDEVLILAMVQYLSECMCELMNARDSELEEVLHFHRRREEGEWEKEENTDDRFARKVFRTVEGLRGKDEPEHVLINTGKNLDADKAEEEELTEADLREEVEKLRRHLAEKEDALAESEQKTIRQRVLYEKEHEARIELERKADEASIEHAELIALREYVYGLKQKEDAGSPPDDLDERSREEIIEQIKDKKTAVLGGTERWVRRMRRILPSWSFVSVEDVGIGDYNALERADYIYIYTGALMHKQYYRAMKLIRKNEKMLFYLGSTNVDECLNQFRKDLCR